MSYNWQQSDWPNFKFDPSKIEDLLIVLTEKMGRAGGLIEGLSKDSQIETSIEIMVLEALKSSAIEGENLNRKDVISSIRNNLGLTEKPERVSDERAKGIGALMVDVRNTYDKSLSDKKLFEWHRTLMAYEPVKKIGAWRTHQEPMQVISGRKGREIVHFEAPPSKKITTEMKRFIAWFNSTAPEKKQEIKATGVRAAIAHLYFVSIHPFEDGNGRIGRAIAEKALSQGASRPVLLSLSKTIEANRQAYYNALKEGQRSNEISSWIEYFLKTAIHAQTEAEGQIIFTLKKSKFFFEHEGELNSRQLRVAQRMLEEGPTGFKGGMSAQKYMQIAKSSRATATRDLQELAEKGLFIQSGGGRSTRYEIKLG